MKMKRIIAIILSAVLLLGCFAGVLATASAAEGISNLFQAGKQGYTSEEGVYLTKDYVSSAPISVSAGQTLWFGPCSRSQYFELVGFSGTTPVTEKIRGKELKIVDTFSNGKVIYKYTVPAGVDNLVFSVDASVASVFTVCPNVFSALTWQAYWKNQGVNTVPIVGENTYYEVEPGTKIYVGGVTEANMVASAVYDKAGAPYGTISKDDLRLVESFGGAYGIYCYTIPEDNNIGYVEVKYDDNFEMYYFKKIVAAGDTVEDSAIIAEYISHIGVPQPLASTVSALKGKSALFLGDSITYGARDRAKLYGAGGWAGRIGYHAGMNVTNNGVSGACITTARVESHSSGHYIYNNLVKTNGTTYDYVIMHGLFNDASIPVEVGTPQGMANFREENADVTKFATALELLFHTARKQNPDAILGYIVNFHTDRAVDQGPYVDVAIQICNDWGIPYLDLYNLAGFSVEFDDGLHPSSKGYDSMYTIVANWMATLGDQSKAAAAEVMCYNVFHKENDSAYNIANRFGKVASLIAGEDSDILLLQEASAGFLSAANSVLSGYEYFGYCNKCRFSIPAFSGGSSSCNHELSPIAWKSEKYTLVDSGALFTDEMPAAAHTDDYPRAINWVVLRDKDTGKELLVMNYHAAPDKDSKNNEGVRNAAAQVVMEKLVQLCQEHGNVPAVFGGDMNATETSVAHKTMLQTVRDIRTTINPGAPGTYNAWDRTDSGKFARGDYLFMTENVNASSFVVITSDVDAETGLHISDHSPIVAQISY